MTDPTPKTNEMETKDDPPTALGSTTPTAEERTHWTPQMQALAARDEAADES